MSEGLRDTSPPADAIADAIAARIPDGTRRGRLLIADIAIAALRALPVEQRMEALGMVPVAERRRSRWSDNWWYWDADSTMPDPWDENQVLYGEAE